MPKQVLRVEIDYPPLYDDGDPRDDPSYWEIMRALDEYEDDDDETIYYTRSVKVVALGSVQETPGDAVDIEAWHRENCTPEECANSATQCVYQGDES